jgi:hypothetical protein
MKKNNLVQLVGDLLTGRESYEWLLDAISKLPTTTPLVICSAFIKHAAIETLLSLRPHSAGRVLVRWQKYDLCTGSSDLSIFNILKAKGWKLYIDTSFHGKIYSLPGVGALIGSANATKSGFSISGQRNREVCTIVSESPQVIDFIENLFAYATLVDDPLFDLIAAEVKGSELPSTGADEWGLDILKKINPTSTSELLICDFLKSNPAIFPLDDFLLLEDLDLIGISSLDKVTKEVVKKKILRVKSIAWLVDVIAAYPQGIYFGELTALLHNALMEDPTPYRSTVKNLLVNSLGWISLYCSDIVQIERPNFSQRIRLRR